MKKTYLLLFILAMSFSACETNDNSSSSNPDDTTFAQNFGASVSRDFIGQVVDAANNPIQNATIKIGTSTVQTDVNGVFIINGASVYEKFAYITAKKVGYIDGSRAMVPTSGKNNVRIMMIENTPQATIQSGETSEVTIYSGTKVVFDGAFQDETGANYTGDVQVSLFHLTPSDENISKLMPGMLYAERESGEVAVLETFGMLNVELRGSAGQELNIKTGHTAEITIRIDDNQLATAPATIPLWHFDEQNGYWKEEGIATKVGNKYVGNVNHFSWWNCDYPYSTVTLTATVNGANGNPISNIAIQLIPSGQTGSTGYTDNNGQISGLIPANQILTLNIYDACGIIYSSTIGPFITNTTLPNFVINNSATIVNSNVVGKLLKCDNTNVTNGYLMINRFGDFRILPVTNGSFSFNEIYCNSNELFTLKGFDFDNLQTTGDVNYSFTPSLTNVGSLLVCNSVNEFVFFKVNNDPGNFIFENLSFNFNSSLPFPYTRIVANDGLYNLPGLQLFFYSNSEGSYNIPNAGIAFRHRFGGGNTITGISVTEFPQVLNLIVNKYGNIGEYVDVSFSGSFSQNDSINTITGVAHVIRDN